MSIETISFRTQLLATMEGFLARLAPASVRYADFFAELIVSLSIHREEGVSLYPAVFVCESLEGITGPLGGGHPLAIGKGPANRETVRRILKQCSPLSERRQWAVYIVLEQDETRYGVFQTERSVLAPTIMGSLRAMQRNDLFLIGLTQLGENVVEVLGANGKGLQFYLSGARVEAKQPTEVIQAFVNAVCRDAEPDIQLPLRDFYVRLAGELTRGLHGSLMAVVPKHDQRLEIFTDAIILEQPVAIPEAVRACLRNPGAEESAVLFALSNLLRGMLSCDGITVFRSDGVLIGYNAFIQISSQNRPSLGGARKRAFQALSEYVGKGITLAVSRSQDGPMDYVEDAPLDSARGAGDDSARGA